MQAKARVGSTGFDGFLCAFRELNSAGPLGPLLYSLIAVCAEHSAKSAVSVRRALWRRLVKAGRFHYEATRLGGVAGLYVTNRSGGSPFSEVMGRDIGLKRMSPQ